MNKTAETMANLLESIAAGERPKFLYFWGHTSVKGAIGKSCLSQWYPAQFTLGGVTYSSSEHYMMIRKAVLFGDFATAELMLSTRNPKEVKDLGRQIKNFDSTRWGEQCEQIVFAGNFGKFSQNTHLRSYLAGTGDQVLVEASPFDRIWGIGLSEEDAMKTSPANWKGKNLLGFALMRVRLALQKNPGPALTR